MRISKKAIEAGFLDGFKAKCPVCGVKWGKFPKPVYKPCPECIEKRNMEKKKNESQN